MPIDNLLPRSAYHVDETGYWGRLGWITGAFFGVAMALFTAIPASYDSNLAMPRAGRVLVSFLSGIPFGLFMQFVMRRGARRMVDGLYDGEAWAIVPPPLNDHFAVRLPCSLAINRWKAAGGVLYLGPHRSVFVSDRRNNGEILELGPASELTIQVGRPPVLSGWQRLFIPRPQPVLEIHGPDGDASFFVPHVRETSAKLAEAARTMRL